MFSKNFPKLTFPGYFLYALFICLFTLTNVKSCNGEMEEGMVPLVQQLSGPWTKACFPFPVPTLPPPGAKCGTRWCQPHFHLEIHFSLGGRDPLWKFFCVPVHIKEQTELLKADGCL